MKWAKSSQWNSLSSIQQVDIAGHLQNSRARKQLSVMRCSPITLTEELHRQVNLITFALEGQVILIETVSSNSNKRTTERKTQWSCMTPICQLLSRTQDNATKQPFYLIIATLLTRYNLTSSSHQILARAEVRKILMAMLRFRHQRWTLCEIWLESTSRLTALVMPVLWTGSVIRAETCSKALASLAFRHSVKKSRSSTTRQRSNL